MSATPCPHGLARSTCEICRLMNPAPMLDARPRRPTRRRNAPGGLATVVIAAVVGFVVLGWLAAAFFAILHVVELVAVAVGAGWVGWQLGVRRGRRER